MISRREAELRKAVADSKDAFERAKAFVRQIAQATEDLTFVHEDGTTALWQALRVEQNASQACDEAMRALGAYVLNEAPARELYPATATSAIKEYFTLARQLFIERSWFSRLLASISHAVIATDPEGRVRFLNPLAKSLTGWVQAEAGGNNIDVVYRLSAPDGQPVATSPLRESLNSKEATAEARFVLLSRTGSETQIEEASAPILDGGRVAGGVTVFAEIAERLRAERAEAEVREGLEDQLHDCTDTLDRTRSEFHELSAHLMIAQEEERRLVARELHSDLSDRAAMAGFEADRIEQLLPRLEGEVLERIQAMHAHIRQLATRLNDIAHRLYPSILEDVGLAAAVRSVVEEHRNAGLEARLTIRDLPPEVPIAVATTLYRIIQEALGNVREHASGAVARLTLYGAGKELWLTVEDDGPGFDLMAAQRKGGLGLWGMQERARLVGGNLLVRTAPGEGTLLLVRVPIDGTVTGITGG
jgi:PAS domain S-box-containing protein